MSNQSASGQSRTLLTPAEVMSRLGVARKTLWRYEADGFLTVIRLPSGHRRYRPEDIEAIERGEVKTA